MEQKTKDKFSTIALALTCAFVAAAVAVEHWMWECGGAVVVHDALAALGVM